MKITIEIDEEALGPVNSARVADVLYEYLLKAVGHAWDWQCALPLRSQDPDTERYEWAEVREGLAHIRHQVGEATIDLRQAADRQAEERYEKWLDEKP